MTSAAGREPSAAVAPLVAECSRGDARSPELRLTWQTALAEID